MGKNQSSKTTKSSPSPHLNPLSNNSPGINPLSPLINKSSPHQSPSLSSTTSKRKKFHKKALSASNNFEIIKVAPGGGKQQKQINNPISCCSILREPHKWEGPIIAVSPSNEAHNFDSKCVRLYSLMEQQYVHVHRMRTRVHGILSAPNALIICTEKEIVVIDPMNDEKLYRKSCAPNPINGCVAALGHRWFAFADYKMRQTTNNLKDIHILPRNLTNNANNYLSPTSSPKLKEKKSKKIKKKTTKNAHLSIYDSNDDLDEQKQNESNGGNRHDQNAENEEFGGLDVGFSTDASSANPYYGLMTNQFDEISKTVQNTVNAVSASTMQFIHSQFDETQSLIKRKQKDLKRKRDEMRA